MKTIDTHPLSGFMELSPKEQLEFDRLRQVIQTEHKKAGFWPLDVPLIYREEVLLAKAGGETEKQVYKLTKGDAKLALRFDLTVPLAAYVTEKQSELAFPFKASQINKVYRGERSQRARFREFYQCDCDVVGRGELDIAYDAEVVGVLHDIYQALGLGKFMIRLSNRKLLNGFLTSLGLGAKTAVISNIIDHAEKVSKSELEANLVAAGCNQSQVGKTIDFMNINGDSDEVLLALAKLGVDNEQFRQGIDEITTVRRLLVDKNMANNTKIDLMIVRGLDYYTGTVFETVLNDYPEIGSVGSGGRYDGLASNYTSENFPGVGASIGLTRLFSVLKEVAATKLTGQSSPVDILIIPVSRAEFTYCHQLAGRLRDQGRSVDILLQTMKVSKKLTYADRLGAENIIVVGGNEVESGRLLVKNMHSGDMIDLDEYLATTGHAQTSCAPTIPTKPSTK
jgi:histidyl-tRNA synthetase